MDFMGYGDLLRSRTENNLREGGGVENLNHHKSKHGFIINL